MLVDSVLQSFGYSANVPAVTGKHVFIYNIVLLKGRHGILEVGNTMGMVENIKWSLVDL